MLPPSRQLQRGKVYTATFRPPQGAVLSEAMISSIRSNIMPPSSIVVVLSNGDVAVTFTSVSSKELTDFDTPIGTFKLLSVRELAT